MIIRNKANRNFTVIRNEIIYHPRLVPLAKIGLIYALSKPDHYEMPVDEFGEFLDIGRDKRGEILTNLEENKYCKLVSFRNDKGHFLGKEYFFFDDPEEYDKTPHIQESRSDLLNSRSSAEPTFGKSGGHNIKTEQIEQCNTKTDIADVSPERRKRPASPPKGSRKRKTPVGKDSTQKASNWMAGMIDEFRACYSEYYPAILYDPSGKDIGHLRNINDKFRRLIAARRGASPDELEFKAGQLPDEVIRDAWKRFLSALRTLPDNEWYIRNLSPMTLDAHFQELLTKFSNLAKDRQEHEKGIAKGIQGRTEETALSKITTDKQK